MTPSQAARILGVAAGFDNRQVTQETATLWSAELRGISVDEAEEAILRHFAKSSDYLMPHHIKTQVAVIRREIERENKTGRYEIGRSAGHKKPRWFATAVAYYSNAYATGLTPETVAPFDYAAHR